MKHKGRALWYGLIAVLIVSLWTAGLGFGGNTEGKKKELSQVNNKIDGVKDALQDGKKESKSLASQIEALERQIQDKEAELGVIQKNISATKSKISAAQARMEQVQREMAQQNENMNQRLRAMYKNGNSGMIEVLLGSSDLPSLVTNIDMISRIYDSDTEVLEAMQATYDKIEKQKKQLEVMSAELKAQEKAAAEKQKEMEASQKVISEKKSEIDKDNKELEAMLDELKAEADALTKEIQRLQSSGTTYSGGIMAWPAPGHTRITSEFGNRIHPTLGYAKFHSGMDIGMPSGSKIVAANAGTVLKAGYSGSYGNMVMIDHGGGIVTLYAHNSRLLVSAGDKVSRGQQIAVSGATGRVTGPHLHFEVRVNGEYKNPRSYL